MPEPPPSSLVPRNGRFVRVRHHLLLVLGCAFVLLLLGSSHWQATASLKALGQLRQQAERVGRLDGLLIQVVDAENAVRGYLLSGNRGHLEPYEKSLETVNASIERIRGDNDPSPANDAALADLSGLVAIKLRSLNQAVTRGMAGEEARIQGKRYTDRIRDRVLAMKERLALEGEDSYERSIQHVERTRWLVATLAVVVLLLMAILFRVLQGQLELREHLATLLQSENQRLDALVRERTTELTELASYLTKVREQEKTHLARELHDELGSLLTAAKMETEWIARKLAGNSAFAPCAERLTRLEELLNKGIALKRRIIDDLHPPLLEMLGLVSALRDLGEDFAKSAKEQLILDLPNADLALDPEPALAVFRIAQEALTNIRKHAQAQRVVLSLSLYEEALELAIEDDGVGFRADSAPGRQHGLAGMKHRVQMCCGEFTLSSRPEAGTRIVARIPLATSEASGQGDNARRT